MAYFAAGFSWRPRFALFHVNSLVPLPVTAGPRRIVLFGPESTGKTSLARDLSVALGEPCAPEYVRQYWDDHSGVITGDDLAAIALGQMAAEDAASLSATRNVILDTDLLTCTIWDDLLFPGRCPSWVREEAERRARVTSLFLLCQTDIPFEPDPQRCFPDSEGRAMCMRVFREALVSRGLPLAELRGSHAERLSLALAAIGLLC